MDYSGKVTMQNSYAYKGTAEDAPECIVPTVLVKVQHSNCPIEVEKEVERLWMDAELGNDTSYYSWEPEYDVDRYPIIAEYLAFRGVVGECLINWWW
jgi:hypothetical protein